MTQRILGVAAALAALAIVAGCGPPPKSIHQFATAADATSYAPDNVDPNHYAAVQATGPNDVATCGDNVAAWTPDPAANGGLSTITLTYDRYVRISDVRVFESYEPGDIIEVLGRASDGSAPDVILFQDAQGDDPGQAAGCPTVFHISVNQGETPYDYNQVVVTLDSTLHKDQNGIPTEIDAVEMVGKR